MFIEITTRKKEKVSLNISQIVAIHSYKNGSVIFDSAEIDYDTEESYDSVMGRIYALITPESDN